MSSTGILKAIEGGSADLISIRRALISVSDKTNLISFVQVLVDNGVELISTGGTAKLLIDAGISVKEVGEYTGFPEILDGRVKTLHPKVHGGLLAMSGNNKHESELAENGIGKIDMVIVNLYPFENTVEFGAEFAQCVENIDIGGPSMLRSSAKNHQNVTVVSSPSQYAELLAEFERNNGAVVSLNLRRKFAAQAFTLTATYDQCIAKYFNAQLGVEAPSIIRSYKPEFPLKYGCNPHQSPAAVFSSSDKPLPFKVLNGQPGYINLLDAVYGWSLVSECSLALHKSNSTSISTSKSGDSGNSDSSGNSSTAAAEDNITSDKTANPVAASFKHNSPAGAAIGTGTLTALEYELYDVSPDIPLSSTAIAYLRARNSDPLCSYGDFAAVSHCVDVSTARIMQTAVCDGVIAPDYTAEALAILKQKKGGKFIILQGDVAYRYNSMEYREVGGMVLSQKRNNVLFTAQDHLFNVVCGDASLLKLVGSGDGSDEQQTQQTQKPEENAKQSADTTDPKTEQTEQVVELAKQTNKPQPVPTENIIANISKSTNSTVGSRKSSADNNSNSGNSADISSTDNPAIGGSGSNSCRCRGNDIASVRNDLILASITVKYTQSNSVAYALNNQIIGVGAGQQSRVDCVKLAGRKVVTFFLRQHPKVRALPFRGGGVKKQEKVNARVRYIEGDFTAAELSKWSEHFTSVPEPLSQTEKNEFLTSALTGVSVASDGFFPFRDSIDHASKFGVKYIAQPGGSIADQEVIAACGEYGMTMVFTDLRLFFH